MRVSRITLVLVIAVSAAFFAGSIVAMAVGGDNATVAKKKKKPKRGPVGPQGPQGQQGSQGAQGPQGIQGVQGEPGLSGYQQVIGNSADSGSENVKTASVDCPDGKRPVGGGTSLPSQNGVADPLATRAVLPDSNGYEAVAYETTATNATWSLQVFAICANVTL